MESVERSGLRDKLFDTVGTRLQEVETGCPATGFSSMRSDGPPAEGQPFLIIGAQKSASTALLRMVQAHPEVFAPKHEVPCFDDPYYSESTPDLLREVFSKRGTARAFGLKRPQLLHRAECPGRIARHLPDAKLIVVLREPTARTVSAYFHYMRAGVIPLRPVDDGLRSILDGRLGSESALARQIIEFSHYGPQLERYRRLFGTNLIPFTDEQLRANPQAVAGVCFGALGVDQSFRVVQTRDLNTGVYSLARLRWLRLGSKLVYCHRMGDDYYSTRMSKPRQLVYYGTAAVDRAIFRGGRGRPPQLSPELRERLGRLFAPDIDAVEDLIGEPLPAWRQGG